MSQVALITGASSGIGAEYARQAAVRGYDLLLVARRKERLDALTGEILKRYPERSVNSFIADLTLSLELESLASYINGIHDLALLVNNAGFGTVGKFADIDAQRQIDMIHVHILASVRLIHSALPGMMKRGKGNIINVSSVGSFFPLPGNVNYCATKTYLNTFSEALHYELKGTGVRVQALCPGFTHTEFHESLKQDISSLPRFMWMPVDKIVRTSLEEMERGHVIVAPGLVNKLLVCFGRGLITGWLIRLIFNLVQI
jgi:short-subunit dehydrogenase